MEHAGTQEGIELRLRPPVARMLLGIPLSELTGRAVELEDVLGPEGRELPERLAQAPGWDMLRAWRVLRDSQGNVGTGALAADLGCSRRHLARRFREEVGLAPKTFARLLRFGRVTRRLHGADPGRLAEVAQDCGYYDQAHLNRDFREFAGLTPSAYTARLIDGGLGGLSGA